MTLSEQGAPLPYENEHSLELTNEIVATTRSRSDASAHVDCGECYNVKEC